MGYRLYNIEMLARFSQDFHRRAVAKGCWDEMHSVGHYLMLAFGELHEGIEADRIGKWAKLTPEQIEELRGLDGAAYAQAFLRMVKDTVEDEISDAVIRHLDLLGWMLKDRTLSETDVIEGLSISAFPIEGQTTLADTLWPILKEACCMCGRYLHRQAILYVIRSLELTCDHLGIDLMTHIELKLKYNETRPALHGKKY